MIKREDDGYITNEEMKQEWLRKKHEDEENIKSKERIWSE